MYFFIFGCTGSLLLPRLSLVAEWGSVLVAVFGLLIVVASLVEEHKL